MAPESNSNNTSANQAAPTGQVVQVPAITADQAQTISSSAGGQLKFDFDPTTAQYVRSGDSLVITPENGGPVTIEDFFVVGESTLPDLVLADGTVLSSQDFFTMTAPGMDIATAAGPGGQAATPPGSGSGAYDDGSGALLAGVEGYGKLGTIYWTRGVEYPEFDGGLEVPGGSFGFGVNTDLGGVFGIAGGLFEDARPYQHLAGGNPLIPGQMVFAFTPTGSTVVTGIHLSGFHEGTTIFIGVPGEPGTIEIQVISTTQVVDFMQANFTTGVYIVPPADSDLDMNISAVVDLRAASSGLTGNITGTFPVVVDAVADKPLEEAGRFDDAEMSGAMNIDENKISAQEIKDGWAKDELSRDLTGADASNVDVKVPFSAVITFGDYSDSSERHYALVEVPSDTNRGEQSGYAGTWTAESADPAITIASEKLTIWYDASGKVLGDSEHLTDAPADAASSKEFFKIEVPNSYIELEGTNGTVLIELTFKSNDTNLTKDTTFDLTTGAIAEETNMSGGEIELGNNISYTFSDENSSASSATFTVDTIDAKLTIKAGWASEDNAPNKDSGSLPNYGTMQDHGDSVDNGVETASTKGTDGAPLNFSIDGAGTGEYISTVVLSNLPAGSLFVGGVELTASTSIGGVGYTISGSTITISGLNTTNLDNLVFKPAGGEFKHGDLSFDYKVTVTSSSSATAEFTGSSTIVVDAVADRPVGLTVEADYEEIGSIANASAAIPGGTAYIKGNITFPDLSDAGAEHHYVVLNLSLAVKQGWTVPGTDDLLSRTEVYDLFQGVGGAEIPTAGLLAPLSLTNPDGSQEYLIIEIVADGSGGWKAVNVDASGVQTEVPGITVSYNSATKGFAFSVETTAPDGANVKDSSSLIYTKTFSVVEDPNPGHLAGEEYDYANNISTNGGSPNIRLAVESITGTVSGNGLISEDGQATQHLIGEVARTDTHGTKLNITFSGDDQGADESVTSIKITELPGTATGSIWFNHPVDGWIEITSTGAIANTANEPSNDFLGRFNFRPADDFSGDVHFKFDATVKASNTGQEVTRSGIDINITVDSVADLAGAKSTASGRTAGDGLEAGAVVFENGWAIQEVGGEGKVDVTFTLDVTFTDLDGSESGYVLVELPAGYSIPAASGYVRVDASGNPDAAGGYAKVATYDSITSGSDSISVTLEMDKTATDKDLAVKVVTKDPDSNTGNDTASKEINQTVKITPLETKVVIKAGWAYEDNKGGVDAGYTPTKTDNAGTAFDETSLAGKNGAPIEVEISGTGTVQSFSIEMPAGTGTFFWNGIALPGTTFVANSVQLGQLGSGLLTFLPNGVNSDSDLGGFNYTITVKEGSITHTITGSTTVVLDAVADLATVTTAASAGQNTDGSLVVTVAAAFADVTDDSEGHYVLVEKVDGWDCAGAEVITVYFDAAGNPLKPTGFSGGDFEYDMSKAASSKEFFKIDVSAEAKTNGEGTTGNYEVTLTRTPGVDPSDSILKVGTLSEEKTDAASGYEWDYQNNQAYSFKNVSGNVFDGDAGITGVKTVYEDNMANAHTGSTAKTFGGFTLAIDNTGKTVADQNMEYVDNSKPVEFTFEFEGGKTFATTEFSFQYTNGAGVLTNATVTGPDASGHYMVTIPAGSLAANLAGVDIRYNAPAHDDTDLVNINSNGLPVITQGTGYTGTSEALHLDQLIVDAVADKPASILTANVGFDSDTTLSKADWGSVITMDVSAVFSDTADGSEHHYIMVEAHDGWTGTYQTVIVEGVKYFYQEATTFDAAGKATATFTLTAPSAATATAADKALIAADKAVTLKTGGYAIEGTIDNGVIKIAGTVNDSESSLVNNTSFTGGTIGIGFNVIQGNGTGTATTTYEDHLPRQNSGNENAFNTDGVITLSLGANGDHIVGGVATDATAGVTAVTMIFGYAGTDPGTFTYNGKEYSVANGSITGSQAGGWTLKISADDIKDGDTASMQVRYNPPLNSDLDLTDVKATISTHADNSKASGTYTTGTFTVIVDAVADKPTHTDTSVTTDNGLEQIAKSVTIDITSTFKDTADGSEKHYVLIEKNANFTPASGVTYSEVTVYFDKSGNPLVEVSGRYYRLEGDTVKYGQGVYTDVEVKAADVVSKTFIQVGVDSAIGNFTGVAGDTQTVGSFDVTLNADGSYTVVAHVTLDVATVDGKPVITADTGDITMKTGAQSIESTFGNTEGSKTNNVGFGDFEDTTVRVAVVESNVSVLVGSAFENNKPYAYLIDGEFKNGKDASFESNGAGILIMREAPKDHHASEYSDEQVTMTFTIDAIKDANGDWIAPAHMEYDGTSFAGVLDAGTGKVTFTFTVDSADLLDQATLGDAGSALRASQIEASEIRLVPNDGNYSVEDINLHYEAKIVDEKSGATKVCDNSTDDFGADKTVVVDAVAQAPEILESGWAYEKNNFDASSTRELEFGMTVKFPDTGFNPGDGSIQTENHFVLVEVKLGLEVTEAFKTENGPFQIHIEAGHQYYMIPVDSSKSWCVDNGNGEYSISIPMTAMGWSGTDGSFNVADRPAIGAMSVVNDVVDGEPHTFNNSSLVLAPGADLSFAVVSGIACPVNVYAYEGDMPNANTGDMTKAGGTWIPMQITLGGSITGHNEQIYVTDPAIDGGQVEFSYDASKGTLYYYEGSSYTTDGACPPDAEMTAVPSGGLVPVEFVSKLVFIPKDDGTSASDSDVRIDYKAILEDNASGATRTYDTANGNGIPVTVVIDAVATQPVGILSDTAPDVILANQAVTFTVTAEFKDITKGEGADAQSDFYVIVEKGNGWSASYETIDLDGKTYYKIPVAASDIGTDGKVTIDVTMNTPKVLINNGTQNKLEVGALTIDRDPSDKAVSIEGGAEYRYDNNYAWSDFKTLDFSFGVVTDWIFDVAPIWENNEKNANVGDHTKSGGDLSINEGHSVFGGSSITGVTLTWDDTKADLYIDGVKFSSTGSESLTKDQFDRASIRVKDGYSDEEIGSVNATVTTADGKVHGPFADIPVVDAVAQIPVVQDAEPDYGTNPSTGTEYEAAAGGKPVNIDVTVDFIDIDGSEQAFVLIEARPGWSGSYPIIGVDGKAYYQVPVDSTELKDNNGHVTVTVTLTPPVSGSFDVKDVSGKTGVIEYELDVRAMTKDTPTDIEWDTANNMAHADDKITVKVSVAESEPYITVSDAFAGADHDGNLVPSHADGAVISIAGLDHSSDTMAGVTLTFGSGHGDLFYAGVKLADSAGVSINTTGGVTTVTITDGGILTSLTSGVSDLRYIPNDYDDADITFGCNINIQDKYSSDTKTHGSSATIIVDAVAAQPDDSVTVKIDAQDFNGAVQSGKEIPISVTGSFPDLTAGVEIDSSHYLVVEQLDGWTTPGALPAGVDIVRLSIDGSPKTYYRIEITQANLDSSNATDGPLIQNPDGSYTFKISLTSPATDHDDSTPAILDGGAMTIAHVDANSREVDLENNISMKTGSVELKMAVVETKNINFTFDSLAEDSATGAAITVDTAELISKGEIMTEVTLYFAQDDKGGNGGGITADDDGKPIATIFYDGVAYTVEGWISPFSGPEGKVTIPFTDGFDPSKGFKIVWGYDDGSGNMVYNHEASSDLRVNVEATIKDTASGATDKLFVDYGAPVAVVATPDGATSVAESDPSGYYGEGAAVTFIASAEFQDNDGSEQHFILVSVLDNKGDTWGNPSGYGTYEASDGKTYYKIPCGPGSTSITLSAPAGISTDHFAGLKIGALTVENGLNAETFEYADTATVKLASVQTTVGDVTVTVAATNEDTPTTVNISVGSGVLAANNEFISKITFTIPTGSTLTYDGVNVPAGGLTFTNGGTAFDTSKLSFTPPANLGGSVSFDCKLSITDKASGATKDVDPVAVSVAVTPLTDDVSGASASAGAPVETTGHSANVTINLQADFGTDNDGSEANFFIVKLPAGVNPPAGWTVANAALTAEAGFTGTCYMVSSSAAGKASGVITLPQNTAASSIEFKAGSYETKDVNGNVLAEASRDYAFSDAATSPIPAVGAVNINPTAGAASGAVADALRSATQVVSGAVTIADADGDTVSITEVNGNSTVSSGVITSAGTYGTLTLNVTTGAYEYKLNAALTDPSLTGTKETFSYEVSDGHGGMATNSIIVTLNAPNSAPGIQHDTRAIGGGNDDGTVRTVSGQLGNLVAGNMVDAEGDALHITSVENGVLNGDGSYSITTPEGILNVAANGSYTFTLNNEHTTVQNVFKVTYADSYGKPATSDITVNIVPVNHAPVVDTVVSVYTGIGSMVMGALTFSDVDAAFQGDSLNLIVNGTPVVSEDEWTTIVGTHGTLSINAHGDYAYTPTTGAEAVNLNAWDSFSVQVEDANGMSDTARISIQLGNPAPMRGSSYHSLSAGASESPLGMFLTGDGNVQDMGTNGQNTIYTGEGDNTIYATAGSDVMISGPGANLFAWNNADFDNSTDIINSFKIGTDHIGLNLDDLLGEENDELGSLLDHNVITGKLDNQGLTIAIDNDGTGIEQTISVNFDSNDSFSIGGNDYANYNALYSAYDSGSDADKADMVSKLLANIITNMNG